MTDPATLPPASLHAHQLRAVIDVAEAALQVGTVAPSLEGWLKRGDDAREAQQMLSARDFEIAPVQGEDLMYVSRDALGSGRVAEYAEPIEATQLITGSLGLTDAVLALRDRDFYFVLEGKTLSGIWSRSDLQQPQVSMVVFAYIVAIEAGLDNLLVQILGDEWEDGLSDVAREKIDKVFADRTERNTEISRLQCLHTSDRINLVGKCAPPSKSLVTRRGLLSAKWPTLLWLCATT